MKNHLKKLHLLIFFLISGISFLFAQNKTIQGKVIADDQEPLIGVTVSEKNNTINATMTDMDGGFSIQVSENSVLVFSYMGYKTKEVAVGKQTFLNVTMNEDTQMLDEVVAIGYGTVKKSDLTGAVSSIKGQAITNTPSASVDGALQGRIPGVFANKKSGKPGETSDIKIRGIGSFRGSGPLWVIDGVQQSNISAEFNMNDVESIEVLRDGSAAAIYGASAANGVVLVTTKKGKKGDAKVNFNAYVGFNNPANLPDMLSSRQLKELRIEDFNGSGRMTEAEILAFPSQYTTKDIRGYALDFEPTNADYNWKDILFSQGVTQNYDLSFSKGTDDYNYYASFNYYDEQGTYMETCFKRYSFRLNSEVKLNSWLSFGENIQMTYTDDKLTADDNYLNNYMRTLPFMMPYDDTNQPGGYGYFPKTYADGTPIIDPATGQQADIKSMLAAYDGSNILADEYTTDRRNNNFNINGNVYLKIQPMQDLSITAAMYGGVGMASSRSEKGEYWYHSGKSRLYPSMNQDLTRSYGINGNLVANYNKTFDKIHALTVMLGTEGGKSYGTSLRASATNMLGDVYQISLADAEDRTIQDSYSNAASLSFFGRVNYTFKDKYIFMAMLRRDGYDRFGPNNRWGNFPSFSGAWRISDEKFIQDNESLTWLTNLKLRASWGVLGNSGIPQGLYTASYITPYANYAYGSTDQTTGYQTSATGVRLNRVPNHDIKWEKIATTNVGLDMSVLNNSLSFSFDWYIKNTSNALFDTSLPGVAGMGKSSEKVIYTLNVGKIKNTGCDFDVTYVNRIGKDFNYSINTNLGFFRNKVLATNEENEIMIAGTVTGGTVSYTQPGLPMGTFFGYKTIGVFQTQEEVDEYNRKAKENNWQYYQKAKTGAGDLIFADINGDGHIDSEDITNIGSPWPDFTYGINIGCNYKWFDFSVFFQGVQGNEIYNDFRTKTHTFNLDYNSTTHILNRWTEAGSTNKNFRLSSDDPNQNEGTISTWFIEDGSYLRMKNIQLGFTLPKAWSKKILMSNCRFYVSAQNLLTFTKYEGFDPEFATSSNTAYGIDTGYYPQGKTVLCGVQVEF